MITKADLIDCLALAVAVFPNHPLEKTQVDGYFELLADLDITKSQLLEAIKTALKTSDYFPTVASIRKQFQTTPTPPPYRFEDAPRGVEMPAGVKRLREALRNGLKGNELP
jgi:hypothetical protein